MFHARQFPLRTRGVRAAQVIGDYQAQDGVAEKLERFVVKLACFPLVAGRHFFVCPGTMGDGAFQQSTIFEVISEDRFEEIEIRSRFGIFQNAPNYKQNAGSLSKSFRRWNRRGVRPLLMVASWFIRLATRLGGGRSLVSSARTRCRRSGSGVCCCWIAVAWCS